MDVKEWERRVLERDKYTCTMCGRSNHAEVTAYLIDHTKLTVENGVTLCIGCRHDSSRLDVTPQGPVSRFQKVTFNFYLDRDTKKLLDEACVRTGRHMGEIIRQVVAEAALGGKWPLASGDRVTDGIAMSIRTSVMIHRPVYEAFERWCKRLQFTPGKACMVLVRKYCQDLGGIHGNEK